MAIFGGADHIPAIIRIPHHLGHAMSAFCTSGLSESVVLVVDGGGSFASHLGPSELAAASPCSDDSTEHISIYYADENGLVPIDKHMADVSYIYRINRREMSIFRSLGHMFSSVALHIFGDYLGAGKVMCLAPLGSPTLQPSQFFKWDGSRFEFLDDIPRMFAQPALWPDRQKESKDLASSTQAALEQALDLL